eukprot:15019590-Ditylum_brightwellii.AAC.1
MMTDDGDTIIGFIDIGRQGNNDAKEIYGLDQNDGNTSVITGQPMNTNKKISHDIDNNESLIQLGSKVKKVRKAKHSVIGLVDMFGKANEKLEKKILKVTRLRNQAQIKRKLNRIQQTYEDDHIENHVIDEAGHSDLFKEFLKNYEQFSH